MIFRLLIIVFIALYFTATLATFSPEKIDRMVVFGDSLSDNGNDYLLTSQLHKMTKQVPIIPDPNFYWGGRFSDGPVWADYLAGIFHFASLPYSPDLRATEQFQNFAYGGAWAETIQADEAKIAKLDSQWHAFPLSLNLQVNDYLFRNILNNPNHTEHVISHDLIFIWIGGNDYLNQELTGMPVARSPNESTSAVIDALQRSLTKLIQAGAMNFVLLGLPDFSNVPNILLRDPQRQSLSPKMGAITALHNQKLQQLMVDFSNRYPKIHISYVNLEQLFEDEYRFSSERAQQYQSSHENHFQNPFTPCILQPKDPDPMLTSFFQFNPILAMSAATGNNVQRLSAQAFPQCDLHHSNDAQSFFNYGADYTAGGIFFDHVHPLTQLHARIALTICRQLSLSGYEYQQNPTHTYQAITCDDLSLEDLLQDVTALPFPQEKMAKYQ